MLYKVYTYSKWPLWHNILQRQSMQYKKLSVGHRHVSRISKYRTPRLGNIEKLHSEQ